MIRAIPWFVAAWLALFSASAFAAPCRMDRPIPVPADILHNRILLHHAVFDQTPHWAFPGDFDPAKNEIFLVTMNLLVETGEGWFESDHLGVSVGFESPWPESVGFWNENADGVPVVGTETLSGLSAKYQSTFTNPAYPGASTHTTVIVEHGLLVSVELTFPIYKFKKLDSSHLDYDGFTGQFQTICLKSSDNPF